MNKQVIQTNLELTGTNYEIGYRLGQMCKNIPPLVKMHTEGVAPLNTQEMNNAKEMFQTWCPGLNEEIEGLADSLKISINIVTFYAMTYLKPRCSQAVLLPKKTASGHTYLVRNYEFSDTAEDFTLMKTNVTGKFSHLGSSVLQFGRDEGMNEEGLAVGMSSCGFPVGAMPFMRNPALKGLQFWSVIRSLLENCKDTKEALYFLKDMPIAYNLNLLLADKANRVVLFETLDGKKAHRELDESSSDHYLFATNHAVLDELKHIEPKAMKHSLIRYDYIKDFLNSHEKVSKEQLKELLLSKFPQGLSCHYYKDFFGTTKSLIMDTADGTIDLCWGGLLKNGWQRYNVSDSLQNSTREITLQFETANPEIYKFIDLK